MTTSPILYETLPGGLARIVLNRPDTRNAQDTAFLYALNEAKKKKKRENKKNKRKKKKRKK